LHVKKWTMATAKTYSFELIGADGLPLRGQIRATAQDTTRPAVVICHGFKGFMNWGFFPHLAERCARAGFTAVSFNFSGSGVGPDGESFSEPERFGHATHTGDMTDIEIVVGALRRGELRGLQPPNRVGLFGHSRGGGAAILFAASHPLDALVTWNAISTIDRWPLEVMKSWRGSGEIEVVNARTGQILPLYRELLEEIEQRSGDDLNILAAAASISAPWLILHGDEDEAVSVADGIKLHHAASEAGKAKLRVVDGGSHTFGAKHPWAGSTPELDTAFEESVTWFARHLV